MKTKLYRRAACAVLAGFLATAPAPGAEQKTNPEPRATGEAELKRAHENILVALRSEQDKLATGKSTLFNVCDVARQVRDAELQMSKTAAERLAAHDRYVALLKGLKTETNSRVEKGVVAPLENKLMAQTLEQAEAELRRENSLAVLRAERIKLAVGKSTSFAVCEAAKQVRDDELSISTTAPQRVAAHNRYVALLKEFKAEQDRRENLGPLAPLEDKVVASALEQAEAELLRAKGKDE